MRLDYIKTATILWLGLICFASPNFAQDEPSFDKVRIETVPLRGGIHMLVAKGGKAGVTEGGNIGISTGEDGVFLVDDQFAPMTKKIQAAIDEVTDKPVKFVFNTHWHGDHAGGNENLGNSGALIVAHDQARQRMSTDQFVDLFQVTIPASPKAALPVVTFNDTTTFHLNGQTIHAFKVVPAHTDGDAVIHFQEADVIHTGDVYFNKIYPLIDVSGGGSLDGMVTAVDKILTVAKDTTQIIPGHGALSNRAELLDYRNMLINVRDRVRTAIANGVSEEEFIAASKPTVDYDPVWGQSFPNAEVFLSTAYRSLDPKRQSAKKINSEKSCVAAQAKAASAKESSKALVAWFFGQVWNPPYSDETLDALVDEHFIITTDGKDLEGRADFKKWVQGLRAQVDNLRVDIEEILATDDGKRVITRMVTSGNNNGIFGTEPDGAPISFTLISIVEVRDGKIAHNWVEKSAFELHQRLTTKRK